MFASYWSDDSTPGLACSMFLYTKVIVVVVSDTLVLLGRLNSCDSNMVLQKSLHRSSLSELQAVGTPTTLYLAFAI